MLERWPSILVSPTRLNPEGRDEREGAQVSPGIVALMDLVGPSSEKGSEHIARLKAEMVLLSGGASIPGFSPWAESICLFNLDFFLRNVKNNKTIFICIILDTENPKKYIHINKHKQLLELIMGFSIVAGSKINLQYQLCFYILAMIVFNLDFDPVQVRSLLLTLSPHSRHHHHPSLLPHMPT